MAARIAVLTFSTCLIVLPATVQGQGFGIYEQGACLMSRGGAGVAEPCEDGAAVYVNPAGLAGAKGVAIGAGGTLVFGSGSFTSDLGGTTKLQIGKGVPPLHGYLRYGITDKLAVGIGGYVPYSLSIEWPLDFGGRFVSYAWV